MNVMEKHTWNLTREDALALMKTNEMGLSHDEALVRLKTYGLNTLTEKKRDGILVLFLRQFASPLIYVLIAAAGIVFFMGDTTDGIIICVVLLLNAFVGTIQEGKAENTLEALKKFVETSATVIRDGKEHVIKDSEVVGGDIITFREGEKISADARIIESDGLTVDESALTGESVPVEKNEHVIQESFVKIADEKNKVFKGTYVTMGNGKAVVTHTGKETEIGKIAEKMSEIEKEIPLKKEISFISRVIVILVLGLSAITFGIGFFMGRNPIDMFLLASAAESR
jgi:magnesium-transporting ATPase (P-type)